VICPLDTCEPCNSFERATLDAPVVHLPFKALHPSTTIGGAEVDQAGVSPGVRPYQSYASNVFQMRGVVSHKSVPCLLQCKLPTRATSDVRDRGTF
jgi:hypothetical protein